MPVFMFAPDDAPGGQPDDDAGDGAPGAPVADGSGTPDPESDLIPRTELQKVNREAAKYRTKLREAEEKLKQIEDEGKSEFEKAQERLTALQTENQTLRSQAQHLQVTVLAGRVGITESAREDAARLLDWDAITDPTDAREIEKALKELVKDRPYLLGRVAGGADGGAGGGTQSLSMNDLLRGRR